MAPNLKILVVEDNDDLREVTVDVLRSEGYQVTGVDCAEAVPEQLGSLDLLVIDLNLPGEDGLVLAKRIRAAQPGIGIIMTTARKSSVEKKIGYESGADIYMPKPVAFEELCAAIASLSRRLSPMDDSSKLQLDQKRLLLLGWAEQQIRLTASEAAMIAAFSRSADCRLESWQLIELLNKEDTQDPKATLELQIVRLRKKLQLAGAQAPTIVSIRGWGYQLCTPICLQ